MSHNSKILIVDDEAIVRNSLLHWFEEDDLDVETAASGDEALKKFEAGKYALVLTDMKMPGMGGIELLEKIKEIDPVCIVILITAFASVPSAIKALKIGAFDYVTKPVDPDELSNLVQKALNMRKLQTENLQLKAQIDSIIKPDNLIGESPQMKKIFDLVNTVAPTDTTVMIRGESGTGKELVAKAIHLNSKRKYFPIVTVNCGALAESILESELFGHEKGAFTGAHHKRKGKFEMAHSGSIFLDEVGTLSPKMQIELLRVIESKSFTRVGGNEVIESDFRVITATNESLENLVKEGGFREDLYYRLNVFSINIPPLRERKTDIQLLAYYFLNKFTSMMNKNIKKISDEALEFLINYEWPGNVRELENAIERAVVVGKSNEVQMDDLPFHRSQITSPDDNSLAAIEKQHILKVLAENDWNISRSAVKLQIDRVTLYNKINKYGLKEYQPQ
ncbi:MAG: sigma-54 dependent transcriptional regulator [Melioribacteraceae bacterium]|nr:sigma-54 dependent transcriptional regulator [Melioribacteraceae bacterium]MCF8263686.1 sigma-54 dependent transcriptional regulator [Melioribacteraceae bacterium]MCF8414375.1 sigma-54 dependent transcriptional regulator [Melioribacteraceae bacterium]MCF8431067.1 sigma-54 dependent transcriptional regulator [Melioribacteraceae bacterium]